MANRSHLRVVKTGLVIDRTPKKKSNEKLVLILSLLAIAFVCASIFLCEL